MFWVVIEGIDRAGKTTLGSALARKIVEQEQISAKYSHVFDTPVGKQLRQIFLENNSLDGLTETLILSAARSAYVAKFIHSQPYDIVITDRFFDSIRSMQCLGAPQLDELVERVARILDSTAPSPDLVLLLDVSPEVLASSSGDSRPPDRIEALSPSFHERVRQQFLRIAHNNPRYVTLDAGMRAQTVFEMALRTILKRYYLKQKPDQVSYSKQFSLLCSNE
jgi:dTMP kinase